MLFHHRLRTMNKENAPVPRLINERLTVTQCGQTPNPKAPIILRDGDGLSLEISPTGVRRWCVVYRLGNKRSRIRHPDEFPRLGLPAARAWCQAVREKVRQGVDPIKERRTAKVETLANDDRNPIFSKVADEWFDRKYPLDKEGSETTRRCNEIFTRYLKHGVHARLNKDGVVCGGNSAHALGDMPIQSVRRRHVLKVLDAAVAAGIHSMRQRLQITANLIFDYAFGREFIAVNPMAGAKLDYNELMPETEHHAAQHEPESFGTVLRKIKAYTDDARAPYKCHPLDFQADKRVIRALLNLLALVFVRPSELRKAEWTEFDLDKAIWLVPFARLKQRNERKRAGKSLKPHRVPLAPQAVAILRELRKITGSNRYLFPSPRNPGGPICDGTVRNQMRAAGIDTQAEQTAHGFRASAKTMLIDAKGADGGFKFRENVIEFALNHLTKKRGKKNDDPYYRNDFFDDRVVMAKWWADAVDAMRDGGGGANVLPFPRRLKKIKAVAA